MFEIGMSALVLKICSEYAKALGLNFPPCVQQEINAIAQYVDLHTVKDLKVEQNGSVATITCFTEGGQEKVFTVTLPGVNVDTLSALLKGSSSVVVDKSEDGRTLVVRLDKSQEVQYVELTPASATQGVLTDTQWNILQANKGNCIILNNEIYRLADNQNVSGLITYVHTGWDGTTRKDKSISITVSTKAWTTVLSGGKKLYLHSLSFPSKPNKVLLTFYHTSNTKVTNKWIYDNLTNGNYYVTFYATVASISQHIRIGFKTPLIKTSDTPVWGANIDLESLNHTSLAVSQAEYNIIEV